MAYYKIGGFEPAIEVRNDRSCHNLAQAVNSAIYTPGSRELRLILGVFPSGATALLLTESEIRQLRSYYQRARSVPRYIIHEERSLAPTAFESLSPISFFDTQDLAQKLKSFEPKLHAKVDNSPANKQYLGTIFSDLRIGPLAPSGVHRGLFEHCRVFWRALQGATKHDHERFGVPHSSWTSSIRVCTFVFNEWVMDNRDREHRAKAPKLLDLGWCEASTPSLGPLSPSTVHILYKDNTTLKNPHPDAFRHGTTETLDISVISARLKVLFKDNIEQTAQPIVLLVFNEEKSRDVLRSLGVNVVNWESGLKGLLISNRVDTNHQKPAIPRDPRRRSRSPRRDSYEKARSPDRSSRRYAPVYVVDVQMLYTRLFSTEVDSDSIPRIARRLHLTQEVDWCAGNEALQIIDVFRTMAKGDPIDEQRQYWMSIDSQTQSTPPPAAHDEDLDDECDPNDIVQPQQSMAGPSSKNLEDWAELSDYEDADD